MGHLQKYNCLGLATYRQIYLIDSANEPVHLHDYFGKKKFAKFAMWHDSFHIFYDIKSIN